MVVHSYLCYPSLYADVNVGGTTRLLNHAVHHEIENFILASSSSVYGKRESIPFKETDPIEKPQSPYAATKRAQELIAYSYHSLYNTPVTCLRFFTVYGPRGRPDMAAYKFIHRITNGQSIQQYGDGQSTRDYTFVSDIVQGIIAASMYETEFDIFNLGGGSKTSLKVFIQLIEDTVGKEAMIDVMPDQPGDLHDTLADISKARKILNYKPIVSLSKGIEKTVEWYQELHSN
jgi:UDP-glucuronate 4-epimerase